MKNGLQSFSGGFVVEDNPGQRLAVQSAVGVKYLWAEDIPDLAQRGFPGWTTWRASSSVSTTDTPRGRSIAATVDFPMPMPPVTP